MQTKMKKSVTSGHNVAKAKSGGLNKTKRLRKQIGQQSSTIKRGRNKESINPEKVKNPKGRPCLVTKIVDNNDVVKVESKIADSLAAKRHLGVFNQDKLKRILNCLADEQQKLGLSSCKGRAAQKVADRCVTSPEHVGKLDRRTKNKTGVLTELVDQKNDQLVEIKDDDSDCCVIFSGPRSTQIPVPRKSRPVRSALKSANNVGKKNNNIIDQNNGSAGKEAAGSATKSPNNDKLAKILNRLQVVKGRRLVDDVDNEEARTKLFPIYRGNGRPIGSTDHHKRSLVLTQPEHQSVVGAKKQALEKRRSNRDEVQTVDKKEAEAAVSLKERMTARLSAARFRYISEMLYTSSGADAVQLFKDDPEAFNVYHLGYQNQLSIWPFNPLDVIIKEIKNLPKSKVVADFGCGHAKLAQSVGNKVYSFDLVALNKHVIACNMDKVPLDNESVDIVVFCLSLMGTNLTDYILEANRVLRLNGLLKIAEVQSRFNNLRKFQEQLAKYGFTFVKRNATYKMFVLMDFKKTGVCNSGNGKLPQIKLQPCVYKKR